jgi:hypothetical protein
MMLNLPQGDEMQLFTHSKDFEQGTAQKPLANAYSIPGCNFVPLNSSYFVTYSDSEGTVSIPAESTGDIGFIAPLHVPNGVTVTEVNVIGHFFAAETWALYRFKIAKDGTGTGFAADVTGVMNTRKACTVLIDNENFCYFISTSAILKDHDTIMGAIIEYY